MRRQLEGPHCPQNVGRKVMDPPTILVIDRDNAHEGTEDVDRGQGWVREIQEVVTK